MDGRCRVECPLIAKCAMMGTRRDNIRRGELLMDDKEQKLGDLSFIHGIKALAEISIVLAAGLFLIGWSYLYGYYRSFGLPPTAVSFSLQSIFMFSVPVIQTCWFLIAFVVLIVLLFIGGRFRFVTNALSKPALVCLMSVFGGILTSRYASHVGRTNAYRDAFASTSTLPYVKLEMLGFESPVGCSADEWNYRLLLRSDGQIYVILPLDEPVRTTAIGLRVCSFPDSQVRVTRIQVGIGRGDR